MYGNKKKKAPLILGKGLCEYARAKRHVIRFLFITHIRQIILAHSCSNLKELKHTKKLNISF